MRIRGSIFIFVSLALALCSIGFAQSLDEVAAINKEIAQLYEQGKFSEAVPMAQRALAIRQASLGSNHVDVAQSLTNLGILYAILGRNSDAEPLFKRSLDIYEKTYGPNHPDVSAALSNLANLYQAQGRYADAEASYKRSLAIGKWIFGPEHPNLAASLNNLAMLYNLEARYKDAEPLFLRALAIGEKVLGPEHRSLADPLNNLAVLYQGDGRYAEAESFFKRALAIREKALGSNHLEVGQSLGNIAQLYEIQGRYAAAEPLYKRSLTILEKALGPESSDVARSLNMLAMLYADQGRYADAESLYKRSLTISEKALGPDHPYVGAPLNNLANLYVKQGRYSEAERLYSRTLQLQEKSLGPNHPTVASDLTNLGNLYKTQGRYADAESSLQRSLAIQEKTLGSDHPLVAGNLNNLGNVYASVGRSSDAEPLYKRSLEIREKTSGPDHPEVAEPLNNLALLYLTQRRYADAEPLYKRSLAIREKALGSEHADVAFALNNLAELYQAQGRYAEALPLVRSAARMGFQRKSVYLAVLSGASGMSLLTNADALNEGYQVVQREKFTAASQAINQLAIRYAAGNDGLAQIVRADQDLAAEAERLDKLILEAISKEPSKRNTVGEQKVRDRISAVAVERTKTETLLRQRFPDYAEFAKPQPLSVQETQRLLGEDEVLVVFDFDQRSYAAILTRSEAAAVELNISAKDLEAQVKAVRSSLTSKDDTEPFALDAAYKLYQTLFGGFAKHIASKKRLYVVSNGALTSLPLQLLVTKDPAGKRLINVDWLVRSFAITNLPSVASLKALRARTSDTAAKKPLIAFADPIFSEQAKKEAGQKVAAMPALLGIARGGREYLEQLPGTRKEVESIAVALEIDPSDIKFGPDASEAAVKNAKLDDYRIVYFATHGLVAGDPEIYEKGKVEPALALSIPDKPSEIDDGFLFASEVAQLKLNADWVVLSGCNTAAGDKPGAEALSGLARAFFYAGARSLLVSHWEVDDKVTATLMTKVFLLTKDNPKLSHGEALQRAMLSILDEASSDEDLHPRWWAPFVVVGETRNSD
jgi:CHAT domain-containing protein/Tfp pilus assembly protein PilF